MTTTASAVLSQQLTTIARSVIGVTTVYSAKPLAHRMLETTIAALTGSASVTELVAIEGPGESPDTITVSIGVGSAEAAPAVCRRVHDAIVSDLSERGTLVGTLLVRVSSVG